MWKGLLCAFPVSSKDGASHDLRVAYIFSSEEAASVKDARERALRSAVEALGRMRNGLGGRYYKTKDQVDARVATIVTDKVAPLINIETGGRDGRPTITFWRNEEAIAAAGAFDGLYALATNLLTRRAGVSRPLTCSRSTRTSGSTSSITRPEADPSRPAGVLAQRRPHRGADRRDRHRPFDLRADRGRARRALGEGAPLPGILPEGRAARPTARAALAAFDGLSVNYT